MIESPTITGVLYTKFDHVNIDATFERGALAFRIRLVFIWTLSHCYLVFFNFSDTFFDFLDIVGFPEACFIACIDENCHDLCILRGIAAAQIRSLHLVEDTHCTIHRLLQLTGLSYHAFYAIFLQGNNKNQYYHFIHVGAE